MYAIQEEQQYLRVRCVGGCNVVGLCSLRKGRIDGQMTYGYFWVMRARAFLPDAEWHCI